MGDVSPPPARASPVAETGDAILLVSPHESDGMSLRRIFDSSQSTIRWYPTCDTALAFLREHALGVVIADAELADGYWTDLLEGLSGLACPPHLVVSTPMADERLWAEVLNLGGYDVLLTPFEPDEVLRVSTGAWLAWKQNFAECSPPRKIATSVTDPRPAEKMAFAAMSGA